MTGLLSGLAIGRNASVRAAETGDTRPAATSKRAKNCILIYLLGGPPHLDMWDMKPHAPSEIRGPFQPIATTVPGIEICEHLPRLAGQMDKLALLRSLSYPNNDHPFMIYHTLTGRVSPVPLGANTVLPPTRQDDPHMGSVVARFKHAAGEVPGYVALPEVRVRMSPVPVSGGGAPGISARAMTRFQSTTTRANRCPCSSRTGMYLPSVLDAAKTYWRFSTADRRGRERFRSSTLRGRVPCGWSVRRLRAGYSIWTTNRRHSATVTAGIASAKACFWRAGSSSEASPSWGFTSIT